jgi:class 3 adenylate cyclase
VWTAAVPAITREDGLIENFTGDGILAVFNAVGDQPDHAARAARAAIAARDAVDALARRRRDPTPRFHFGINTGPAFVGSVGVAGRRTFSAIGDTTNLGARLLGAAPAGQIVVGAATWARLATWARGVALPPLRLRGKRDPVPAWRLEGLVSG